MTLVTYLLVGIGGALGAFCRAYLIGVIEKIRKHWLFKGAFFVNCASCLIAGASLALALGPLPQAVVMTGFCGGFSTLSSVNLDAAGYLFEGNSGKCVAYLALTYAGALAMAGLGFAVMSTLL